MDAYRKISFSFYLRVYCRNPTDLLKEDEKIEEGLREYLFGENGVYPEKMEEGKEFDIKPYIKNYIAVHATRRFRKFLARYDKFCKKGDKDRKKLEKKGIISIDG